ncbi:hypothetical protein [Halomonas binhaiensis]|uniref:Uncharacterized protein n=1 Tax=Halomonas binhaiensis TaxID=2562282 RepID=A0A5C1NKS3_9GAMM|nr:hypothetical protein [Halomonas binhaiensis]QEM82695.1 hypothetical protein E4T21_14920 [Halomonas binhaiensis]
MPESRDWSSFTDLPKADSDFLQQRQGGTAPGMANETGAAVRLLTPAELAELRRDMAEASAWARAELKRRRPDE